MTERLHFHFSLSRRRKWQPTPVFLPGESQLQGSLVGCRLWGRTESDTTEVTAAPADMRKGLQRLSRKETDKHWGKDFPETMTTKLESGR